MKAMVLESQGQLTYKDVAEPERVGARPVLVRIAAVGVCGSDLLRYAKGTAYHYPLILGHEFSAVVEEAPADSAFARGDRVAVFPLIPNLRDPFSQIGEYAVSSGYDYFGSRRDGAFAEWLWAPEENLLRIPPEVPLIERVRFMGIFSNNLDEFYRVRYADVRRLAAFSKGREKARWEKLLEDIDLLKRVNLVDEYYHVHEDHGHELFHIHNY